MFVVGWMVWLLCYYDGRGADSGRGVWIQYRLVVIKVGGYGCWYRCFRVRYEYPQFVLSMGVVWLVPPVITLTLAAIPSQENLKLPLIRFRTPPNQLLVGASSNSRTNTS